MLTTLSVIIVVVRTGSIIKAADMGAQQSIPRAPNDMPQFGPHGSPILLSDLGDIQKTSKYADFTLTCNGHEWQVYKVVVCLQSEFFARRC